MRMYKTNRVGKTTIMKSLEGNISSCRHCRFYRGEGRRGGSCQQLGVPVQGSWKVCPLAVSPFKSKWQMPGLVAWQRFDPDFPIETEPLSLESELTATLEQRATEDLNCPEAS
jgi:hypothetical protein